MTEYSLLAWPWKADPFAAATLAMSAMLYGIGSLRSRPRWRDAIAFVSGWVLLAWALLSPMATASDVLFSWHMTQHELLMLVCAPLLALGKPLAPMVHALPSRWRRPVARVMASRPAVRATSPLAVFLIHAVLLWVWHVPSLFEAAVRDEGIHLIQHISFAGSACLFWWTMLNGRYGRGGYGAAAFYVFVTAVHSGSLGALATLSDRAWYPLYVDRAGHAHDALVDQQVAGLIMWIPSGITMMLLALALFAAWLGHAEHRRQRGWDSPATPWRTP